MGRNNLQSAKVALSLAEKAKGYLLQKGFFILDHKINKDGKNISFPVKLDKQEKEEFLEKFPDAKIGKEDFEAIQKSKSYKESLEIGNLPSSYDIIGSIIIVEIKPEIEKFEGRIAQALLMSNKNIKTILKKSGQHGGEFRTQDLKYLAGENTKETIYNENNIRLKLDVEQVYFSPRLSTERKRVYEQVKPGEDILVMFSGCGPYPISISKNTMANKIVAIEKNPVAHKYALENKKINKIMNVDFIFGDVRTEVPILKQKFGRILMPLPKAAEDFLGIAIDASKKGTIIHFYDFEHEKEIENAKNKVEKACKEKNRKFQILRTVKCGQYSPGKYRICVDFEIMF